MTFLDFVINFISEDSITIDWDERDKRLAELEQKPLHFLEINLEIAHNQIAYLPGRNLIFRFHCVIKLNI